MKKSLRIVLMVLFLLPVAAKAQFETFKDSVVQLYGVVMTADSLTGIPAVSVVVKGQNRGTITNDQGVFSIVVLKGDDIEFSSIGYKPKLVAIPKNLEGNQQSIREGGDLGVPVMMSDDEISKQAFIDFASNATRGIAMRNAEMPATEVSEVLGVSGS
jgi:hypothetical protein